VIHSNIEKVLVPVGYKISPADIVSIKRFFSVSFNTVVERLHQCALINSEEKINFYRLIVSQGFKKKEPNALDRKEFQFNTRFEDLLRKAYENELISMNKVAELYGKNIKEVRKLIKGWGEFGSES
jgi:effector-binding domain-containing protein